MKKKSIVIVGNGMATGRLLDELIKRDHSNLDITVIGDEIHGCYNRIMLSPVLAGETTAGDIINKPVPWYRESGIRFVSGQRVERIDAEAKQVETQSGEVFAYDELVLAAGSRPARIPAKNQQLQHIYSFRTLDDVDRIAASAEDAAAGESAAHAVVVGGGLLGLEAAYGLATKGLEVTLVHRSAWLLNRQLDKQAGDLLKQVMEQKNIRFKLSREIEAFVGDNCLQGVRLNCGEYLPCQLAVIATGITPNKELGISAGLAGARGVAVDAYMRTSDAHISAIGECIEFNGATYGLVDPIWRQCVALADRLASATPSAFVDVPVATKLKVSGVQLFSAGEHITKDEHREIVHSDAASGIYRKLLLKDGRIVGIVLFGDTRDGYDYFSMLEAGTPVGDVAPLLLLGKAFYQLDDPAVAA